MIIGQDFKFRDDIKRDTVPIEILVEPYKGVVYNYLSVKVVENVDEGTATLRFGFEVIDLPDGISELSLRTDKKFTEYTGLILNALILEAAEIGGENNAGIENTGEPDKTRELREESSSVSQA